MAIKEFDYRSYARRKLSTKLNAPRLRGLELNGRVAVFYSREDLSEGLVGQNVDGVLGYAPSTATQIMRNILMYADPLPSAQAPAAAAPVSKPKKKNKAN